MPAPHPLPVPQLQAPCAKLPLLFLSSHGCCAAKPFNFPQPRLKFAVQEDLKIEMPPFFPPLSSILQKVKAFWRPCKFPCKHQPAHRGWCSGDKARTGLGEQQCQYSHPGANLLGEGGLLLSEIKLLPPRIEAR